MRYEGSAAGVNGDGKDVLLDWAAVVGGDMDTTEDGRDGKSCDKRSDPPEVFFRVRGGRACEPTAGEPVRRAVGTSSTGDFLWVVGEPTCSGDGIPAMSSRVSMVCAEIAAGRETIRLPAVNTYAFRGTSHTLKEIIKVMQEQAHEAESHSICYTPAAEGCLSTCAVRASASPHATSFRLDVTNSAA